jgi:hypothetical protein
VLAAFDGDLIRRMTPPDDPRRFTRSVQQLAVTLLGRDDRRPGNRPPARDPGHRGGASAPSISPSLIWTAS